jgi:hypothetical protein
MGAGGLAWSRTLAGPFRIDDGESLLSGGSFEAFVGHPEHHLAYELSLQPEGCCQVDRIESSRRMPPHQAPNVGESKGIDENVVVGMPFTLESVCRRPKTHGDIPRSRCFRANAACTSA